MSETSNYAARVVQVLRDHTSWLPTSVDAEIVTECIERQVRDPQDSFEVIVDSVHAANWRLKARSDDRSRVRLACFSINQNTRHAELERTVNDALRGHWRADPMTAEPLRVFDLFDPGRPDPVLEAEVAAHHATYPDPRSYEARKAWRDAHPDQKAPVRRTGKGVFADLRDALDPEAERAARKGREG